MNDTLSIGEKYLATGVSANRLPKAPLIFIGFNSAGQGRFLVDDQALFDTLGQPYSKDVILAYANNNDLDDLGKSDSDTAALTVYNRSVVDENGERCWFNHDEMLEMAHATKLKMDEQFNQVRRLASNPFYATDCPGGETYNTFLNTFKQRCREQGLSLHGFTYHGTPGQPDLAISHNGYAKTGEDEPCKYSAIFFALEREPRFARMRTGYMHGTNQPEL